MGGHTCEGAELALGLSVNGVARGGAGSLLTKGGAAPGDALVLTKAVRLGLGLCAIVYMCSRFFRSCAVWCCGSGVCLGCVTCSCWAWGWWSRLTWVLSSVLLHQARAGRVTPPPQPSKGCEKIHDWRKVRQSHHQAICSDTLTSAAVAVADSALPPQNPAPCALALPAGHHFKHFHPTVEHRLVERCLGVQQQLNENADLYP